MQRTKENLRLTYMENLREEFKTEINTLLEEGRMSPRMRKRKLITWVIRTLITLLLYIIFWKYEWVRYTLFIYIPLSVFSLISILAFNYLLERKAARAKAKMGIRN